MSQHPRVLTRFLSLLALSVGLASCGGDSPATPGLAIAGHYVATTLQVAVPGQPVIDVLAQGGALTLTIAANGNTTGSLVLPASVTGGAASTTDLAGVAVQTGSTMHFQQSADTFVRDLSWTVSTSTLSVNNQAAGGAEFTIVLTRQ